MSGSTLASLFIALGLKTEGVATGARVATQEIEQIAHKGSAATASLGTSLSGLQAKLTETGFVGRTASSALGMGLGLIGVQAVQMGMSFVTGIFSAVKEEAKLDAQTQAVLASTRGAAHVTESWTKEYALQLSNVTGQSVEVVQSTENMLLTFTSVQNRVGEGNDIFNQATSTVLNMAQALGEDSKSAAIQLGKALNDPIAGATALKRVGVQLTESQKEQIKTFVESGNIMGAQKVILAELATEFGGSAKAFGDSAAGTSAKFGNAVVELQKAVGGVLLPVLNAIITPLTWLFQHMEIFGPILAGVAAIVLSVVVPAVWAMVAGLFAADAAAAPITLTMLAIGAAVGIAVFAFNQFPVVREVVSSVFGVITTIVKGFVGTMLMVAGAVVGVIAALPGPLQEGAKAAQKVLDDMRASVDKWGTDTGPGATDSGLKVGMDLSGGVDTGISTGIPKVALTAQQLVDTFGTSLSGVKKAGVVAGGAAMEGMAKQILADSNAPLNALKTLHTMVKTQLSKTQELAMLAGELTSTDLAKGLASKNPAVQAQAIATRKLILDQMSSLGVDAKAAGELVPEKLAVGMVNQKGVSAIISAGHILGQFVGKAIDDAVGSLKPTTPSLRPFRDNLDELTGSVSAHGSALGKVTAVETQHERLLRLLGIGSKDYAGAVADLNKQIETLGGSSTTAGSTASHLQQSFSTAFDTIKQKAQQFFDVVHQGNLKTITALQTSLQAPIDAAKAALQASQTARQLEQLQQSVDTASDPLALAQAQQALGDFVEQQRIDTMQRSANEQIAVQTAAENKRFAVQTSGFGKQLSSLQTELAKHPKEWQAIQEKVITLLHSYGVTYQQAGASLGLKFADGLKSALTSIQSIAHSLLGTSIKKGEGNAIQSFTSGATNIANDQLAFGHSGEMIPATVKVGASPQSGGTRVVSGGGPLPSPASSMGSASLSEALAAFTAALVQAISSGVPLTIDYQAVGSMFETGQYANASRVSSGFIGRGGPNG